MPVRSTRKFTDFGVSIKQKNGLEVFEITIQFVIFSELVQSIK